MEYLDVLEELTGKTISSISFEEQYCDCRRPDDGALVKHLSITFTDGQILRLTPSVWNWGDTYAVNCKLVN